jgi:predicted anti-sigma-YlaC factor YlaD
MYRPLRNLWLPGLLAGGLVLFPGCSIKKVAINKLGNALASGGTTFSSDDDPELVRSAIPFSLKLIESLLAESPKHEGLLLAAASGFTQYSYAFIQQEADELEEQNLTRSRELKDRARKLYRRARDYGMRGLEVRHAGITAALSANPKEAVQLLTKKDVPLMYWTAASWGSLISLSKDQPDIISQQPVIEALLDRAVALDENFEAGALHSALISYELSRQGGEGKAADRARKRFARATELSGGLQAGPYLSLAEGVCLQDQNAKEFKALLEKALAIDVDAKPEWRLANLVMQRRARWLLSRLDDLFVPELPPADKKP